MAYHGGDLPPPPPPPRPQVVGKKAPPPPGPPPKRLLDQMGVSTPASRREAKAGSGHASLEEAPAGYRETAQGRQSVHGGFSGSIYDVEKSRSLGRLGTTLASSVTAMVSNRKNKLPTEATGYGLGEGRVGESMAEAIAAAGAEGAKPRQRYRMRPARGFRLLDEDHLTTLRTIFEMLDTDVDGWLDNRQLRTAVTAVGIPPTKRFLARIHAIAGRDGCDFDTFVAAVEQKLLEAPIDASAVEDMFKRFRTEGRDDPGHVSAYHMMHVLSGIKTSHHTELTSEEVEELFSELHIDYADPIDYKEFVKALTSGFVQLDEGDREIHFA